MAEVRKILGQKNLASSTVVTAYDVPDGDYEAIISALVFCNRGAAAALCAFVVTAGTQGSSGSAEQYIYWDLSLPADDTFVATIGLTLSGGDQIRVAADSALASAVSIGVFGVEIT